MTSREYDETRERIINVFNNEEYDDQRNKPKLVQNKLHRNPQLNAFLILEKYNKTEESEIIKAADHDEIFLIGLDNCNEKMKEITQEELLDLLRCGVDFNEAYNCFYMFT